MPFDPQRVLRDLHDLHRRTADDDGAQRVAWTPVWTRARQWFRSLLDNLPVEVETDEAGNVWTTLPGRSQRSIVLSGHIDSVPNGGWLDGSLGLLGGLECLRALAADGPPPLTVRLVDWADEEGARFGRSLLGSSAAAGSLDLEQTRRLRADDGTPIADVLRQYDVDLDRMLEARGQLDDAAACLELHIEQGPVLEAQGLPLGVVVGTFGVERHRLTWTGQAAHAGSTPMDQRRDAFSAAARFALEARRGPRQHGGVATVGSVEVEPGIPTAVAGRCRITLDQRHLESEGLAALLDEARAASERIAEEERVDVCWEPVWRIDPIAFDRQLIELAEAVTLEVAGAAPKLASGPLHDAAEPAQRGVPTVMLFTQSLRGLSHCKEEDTREEHLVLAVEALWRLLQRTSLALEGNPQ